MITYEYQCAECGEPTEAERSLSDRDIGPACPQCGGVTSKIITSMNFRLKGRGWGADRYSSAKDQADLV